MGSEVRYEYSIFDGDMQAMHIDTHALWLYVTYKITLYVTHLLLMPYMVI